MSIRSLAIALRVTRIVRSVLEFVLTVVFALIAVWMLGNGDAVAGGVWMIAAILFDALSYARDKLTMSP